MNQTNTMKEMPKGERPYEKCEQHGVGSLTDVELLAILLRTGTKGENVLELSRHILSPKHMFDGLLNLHHWTLEELVEIKGMGKIKAIQILCISELAKRLSKACAYKGLNFTTPSTIANYYMEDLRHQKQEQMKLLMLNTKSRLIGESNISKGTVNASLITPRELFIEALKKNAVSIILLHNHPSGDPTPSREDILVTKRIQEAGNLIGIDLLDHIIIGNNCYISFCEKKLI
ncbi:RadC family protein [Lachnospiraceae bacterium LCP25S3_G4]